MWETITLSRHDGRSLSNDTSRNKTTSETTEFTPQSKPCESVKSPIRTPRVSDLQSPSGRCSVEADTLDAMIHAVLQSLVKTLFLFGLQKHRSHIGTLHHSLSTLLRVLRRPSSIGARKPCCSRAPANPLSIGARLGVV